MRMYVGRNSFLMSWLAVAPKEKCVWYQSTVALLLEKGFISPFLFFFLCKWEAIYQHYLALSRLLLYCTSTPPLMLHCQKSYGKKRRLLAAYCADGNAVKKLSASVACTTRSTGISFYRKQGCLVDL